MNRSAAILIDTTRCTGCEECIVACKEENGLGPDRLRPGQTDVDALSSTRFSTILRRPDELLVKQQCLHCLEPACVSACLVGALQKTPEGPVIYDNELCMGCRYCMVACPWGIPRYEWDEAVPYVRKCTLCHDRILEGRKPACVEACPDRALYFGTRDQMLREARRRIALHPDRYLDHVYGEGEAGGTSVLYLADRSLGFLAWSDDLGRTPLPELTWASLVKVPPVILGMGGLMTGIWWVVQRRMKLAARAGEEERMARAGGAADSEPTAPETGEGPEEGEVDHA